MAGPTVIDGPFGRERAPVPEVTEPALAGGAAVPPDGPEVPINDYVLRNDAGFGDNRAARESRGARPDASLLESVGAAVSQWTTTRMVDRFMRPAFEDDNSKDFNSFDFLSQVPLALDEDELDYFNNTATGDKSAAYAIEKIKDQRTARQAFGDHPVAALAASFGDPVWLAVPPAIRVGRLAGGLGRTVSALGSAGVAGGITAIGEGPTTDQEIALSMLTAGAAGAVFFRAGRVVPRDVEFPGQRLTEVGQAVEDAVKPRFRLVTPGGQRLVSPATFGPAEVDELGRTFRPKTAEAVYERVEPVYERINEPKVSGLAPGPTTTQAEVADAVEGALNADAKARGWGETLQWNMRKTMSNYGTEGKRVADLLYDNNSDLSRTSVEAHREAILHGLRQGQQEYENLLRTQMAAEGAGFLRMVNPFTSREAHAVQRRIEKEVQLELFRREQTTRAGGLLDVATPRTPVGKMADALDNMHKKALAEMKAAGVEGAEDLLERAGYLNRKWSSQQIDGVLDRLEARGLTREAAQAKVDDLVALALRRANPKMDAAISKQIGSKIVDRALRKGYFEDGAFNGAGDQAMGEIRDVLKGSSLSPQDQERILDTLRVETDEAGKAGLLKFRLDLDYRATLRVGNENIGVTDLIDSNVTSIVDQYLKQVSTASAFARSGLRKRTDIQALREELLKNTPVEMREQAKDLFDNTMDYYRGAPNGAKMNENFRLLQQYGRTISLPWSGLWQATEYANILGAYGLKKTLKAAIQEIPGFKAMMTPDGATAKSLNNVLSEWSAQSMRLRPYLARYEDGYDMDTGNALQLASQTWGNSVPMANGMKFVHHHQAKMVGNLILDRLDMAAKGDAKARAALETYGLKSPVMDTVAVEIQKHGFEVDKWSDSVWAQVRPSVSKMMDSAVLKGRLGDMPAFAAFDPVGKFAFTYRTFVLAAHNKKLAGEMAREGASAVGMIMLYQFPLAMAAVQAQNVVRGEGVLGTDELVKKSLGQMGALGLFSEPLKWATGESNSIGAPALIPVDRGVKLFQSGLQMDPNATASAAMTMFPVISAVPFIRGAANMVKE